MQPPIPPPTHTHTRRRYLDPQGHTVSRKESARIREALMETAMAHRGESYSGRQLPKRHGLGQEAPQHGARDYRPASAALSRRSALQSTRGGRGYDHTQAYGRGERDAGQGGGAGAGLRSSRSQAWPSSRRERYAKEAVKRAIREKRAQRAGGMHGGHGYGGSSNRSLGSAASNTWLALGHTARSSASPGHLRMQGTHGRPRSAAARRGARAYA